jgi:hypothetical protein
MSQRIAIGVFSKRLWATNAVMGRKDDVAVVALLLRVNQWGRVNERDMLHEIVNRHQLHGVFLNPLRALIRKARGIKKVDVKRGSWPCIRFVSKGYIKVRSKYGTW